MSTAQVAVKKLFDPNISHMDSLRMLTNGFLWDILVVFNWVPPWKLEETMQNRGRRTALFVRAIPPTVLAARREGKAGRCFLLQESRVEITKSKNQILGYRHLTFERFLSHNIGKGTCSFELNLTVRLEKLSLEGFTMARIAFCRWHQL